MEYEMNMRWNMICDHRLSKAHMSGRVIRKFLKSRECAMRCMMLSSIQWLLYTVMLPDS